MASDISVPVELGRAIQLRTVSERDGGDTDCDSCGRGLAHGSHLRGTVRHHALGDTEYTDHRFCDAGCLDEWVREVRAAGGDIDWRADESW